MLHQVTDDQTIVINDGAIQLLDVLIPLAVPEVEIRQDRERRRERVMLDIDPAQSQRFADAWHRISHATWKPDAPGMAMPPELVDPFVRLQDRLVASSFVLEEGLFGNPAAGVAAQSHAAPNFTPSLVVSGYSPTQQRRVLHVSDICYCELRCANAQRDHALLMVDCRQHPPSLRLFDGRYQHAG